MSFNFVVPLQSVSHESFNMYLYLMPKNISSHIKPITYPYCKIFFYLKNKQTNKNSLFAFTIPKAERR